VCVLLCVWEGVSHFVRLSECFFLFAVSDGWIEERPDGEIVSHHHNSVCSLSKERGLPRIHAHASRRPHPGERE